jgi:hypothetical protein
VSNVDDAPVDSASADDPYGRRQRSGPPDLDLDGGRAATGPGSAILATRSPGRSTVPRPARHEHQAAGRARQHRADLCGVGGVIPDDEQPASRGARAELCGAFLGVGRQVLTGRTQGPQEAAQDGASSKRRTLWVEPGQVGVQRAVREAVRDLVGPNATPEPSFRRRHGR